MGGGGGWLGVILNGPILNGLRCISACKTRGIVESGSEHQNENAKIYNFNNSNMFNPLPIDQVYPLSPIFMGQQTKDQDFFQCRRSGKKPFWHSHLCYQFLTLRRIELLYIYCDLQLLPKVDHLQIISLI